MSKRKHHSRSAAAVEPQPAGRMAEDRLHPWLLAGLIVLYVARVLVPSEAVSWVGDGQAFNMLWIVLAAAVCLSAVRTGGLASGWRPTDGAVALLVALNAISAIWGAVHGSPRPSINMFWEWVSLGLGYLLVRQLVRSERAARGLVAVMIALAVGLAAIGVYQYRVDFPEKQAQYDDNPDKVLREAGHWIPPDSPERALFESRLRRPEPLATFSLTNSLAAFLAPWLVIAVGIGATALARRREAALSSGYVLLSFLASALVIGCCLLLTKSRSGYVAGAVGLIALPMGCGLVRRWNWKIVGATVAAIALAVLGLAIAARANGELLDRAWKSFGFRLEYWRSTLEMVKDHPWLGCGPGNFQDYYTQYKLPEAAEEVRDPHNFLFEIWSTAGSGALAAMLLVLGCFARETRRGWRRASVAPVDEDDSQPATGALPFWALAASLAGGFLLGHMIGSLFNLSLSGEIMLLGFLAAAGSLALSRGWIARGKLHPELPAIGVAVLLIDLLAAGGIAFPGVACTLWMLIAIGVNQASRSAPPAEVAVAPRRKLPAFVGLVLLIAAAAACYWTAYAPVLRANAAMMRYQSDAGSRDWFQQEQTLAEAAIADPFSAEPWKALAALRLSDWKEAPGDEAREAFWASCQAMLEREPRSSTVWAQTGAWRWEMFLRERDEQDAREAVRCYRRAIELYPNEAALHAHCAVALEALEDPAARQEAARALELDRITPHANKKLAPPLRRRMIGLTANGSR